MKRPWKKGKEAQPVGEARRSQLLTTQDTPLARTVPAHEHGISTLAVHPEGGLLVAIDSERNAYVWDITDPTQPHLVSDRFGAEIYRLLLPVTTRIELTEVHGDYDGDTRVPPFGDDWREVAREDRAADGDTPAYSFVTLERPGARG